MNWRKIQIGDQEWSYSIGMTNAVIIGPGIPKDTIALDLLTGHDVERGRHKKSSDGMVTPKDIRRYITLRLKWANAPKRVTVQSEGVTCTKCKIRIKTGEDALWSKNGPDNLYRHPKCPKPNEKPGCFGAFECPEECHRCPLLPRCVTKTYKGKKPSPN